MNRTYLQRTMRRLIGAAAVILMLGAGTAYAKNLNVYTWSPGERPCRNRVGRSRRLLRLDQVPADRRRLCYDQRQRVGSIRYLTFEDGMKLDEPMADQGPTHFTYIMSKGFLTDARYRSTLRAYPATDPGTSVVEWIGQIDADVYEDGGAEMAETLRGIYQMGLDNIKKMFE